MLLLKFAPLFFIFSSVFVSSCTSLLPRSDLEKNQKTFFEFQKKNPDLIWNSHLSPKTRAALKEYQNHQHLKNGLIYGDSVRHLNLKGKSASSIDEELQKKDCLKRSDFLQNSKTHAALLDSHGKKIPFLVYLCPDGGVVRIKPIGDPTSQHRPQPHASKSLRYPADAPFLSFDDEIVKVDNQGFPVPKWAKDLNLDAGGKAFPPPQLLEGWAEDAHTDLPN
jgi:hypothetical protein